MIEGRFNAQSTNQPMGQQAFSVSEVNAMVADAIAANLPSFLWVEGEVSNLSVASSGHRYLSLQDNGATISCALFRGSASRIHNEVLKNLKNGDKVLVKASVSVYKPRGSYQLIISDIEPAGFGELAKNFVLLKQKLDKQGLTAQERKRPIPSWARHIAVVTSATGAAVRDVLTTLKRRAPFIAVTVYPVMVQGEKAAEQIIQALSKANKNCQSSDNDDGHDVILLVRGGGSIEDLQAFNDEKLAYAVANSELPVVTGVGHETDFTIVDFVSDYRTPTPTGAAEIASPDRVSLEKILKQKEQQLVAQIDGRLSRYLTQLTHYKERLIVQHPVSVIRQQSQRLDELDNQLKKYFSRRLESDKQTIQQYKLYLKSKSPYHQLQQSKSELAEISDKLKHSMQKKLMQCRQELSMSEQRIQQRSQSFSAYQQQLKGLQARLTLLSPLGILDRGYAVVFDEQGELLKSSEQLQLNEALSIRLAKGRVKAIVSAIEHSEID